MNDVTLARIINKVHGGPVISAMEIESLDETWVDVFLGIAIELPAKTARQQAIKNKFAEFERSHPTYGQRFTQ